MKIEELLVKLADDEVTMQGLNGAISSVKKVRHGSAVTFHTEAISAGHLLNPAEMPVVICLFINRAAFDRECAKEKAGAA